MEKEAKDSIFLASKRYTNYMEGTLNETVALTKRNRNFLKWYFEHNNQVDANLIESLMKIYLIVVYIQLILFCI